MRSISRWTIIVLAVLAPVGSLAAIGIASAASPPKPQVCKDVTAKGGNYQATGIRVTKMGCAEARTYLATWLKQGSKSLPHYKQYWHSRKIAGGRWLAAYGTTKVPPTIAFMIKVPKTRPCADVMAKGGKYMATNIRATNIGITRARSWLASWLRQGSRSLPHNKQAWHSRRIAGGRWRVEYGTKKARPTITFMIRAVHKPAPKPTPPAPDTQAPAITLSAPAEGARYEIGQAVTAHFACTDNVQVASCSGTLPDGSALPTDKLGTFTFTVTATDTAGNMATKTVTYSVVDTTPPKIMIASPTDGAKLEAGTALTAHFTCTDNVAVESCDGTFADGAAIPTNVTGTHQFVVTATDTSGNVATVRVSYTVGDTTPPQIAITAPTAGSSYAWGQAATAQYSCSDNIGIASCTATVGTATVAKGAALPTTGAPGPGTRILTVTATDTSGNTTTQKVDYVVQPAGYYALTFHDGPNGDYTQKVLDALKSVNAHATFFLVGSQVTDYPALAQAIVAAGMQVGNHTMNHYDVASPTQADGSPNPFYVAPNPPPTPPVDPNLEITAGRDAIIAATGVTPKWFEPPYGDYGTDSAVQTMVTAAGETLCAWTVDSTDSSSPQPTSAQIVAAATQVGAGGIIEMHDASQATVDAVAPIVTQLANNKGLLPGQITASATGVPGPFGSPQPAYFCTAGAWPAS